MRQRPVAAALGQCSWDIIGMTRGWPEPDAKEELAGWLEQGGGPAATALATLARLGCSCRFAGVVGDDDAGGKILRSLEEEGIALSGVKIRHGAFSQAAFIAVEEGTGRRTIFWRRATGVPLAPEEIAPGFLDGCSFLLLDGLMPEASLAAAADARRRGIPVLLDAGRVRPGMLELASACDYVIGAEEFFRGLGWDGQPDSFRALAAGLGSPVAGVTLGERGSMVLAGDEIIVTPAFAVSAVDTTGAGDVFHGALAAALLERHQLRQALRFAAAAAALSCLAWGGRAGIASRDETMAFMTTGALRPPPFPP